MSPLCALQGFGPQLQVADLLISEFTQLAVKLLASCLVIWCSFTELVTAMQTFRAQRIEGVTLIHG